MKTIELKLFQKNQFQYQIKNSRKVLDKIVSVKGGWYTGCKIFETIELAVEYQRFLIESQANAFSINDDVLIVIKSA
jgi:hypothetical protein